MDVLAPQVAGVKQRHLPFFNIGVDWFLGFALENQAIEPRPLEPVAYQPP